MNVKIILTSYFLKFMYGDRAYDDPLLLSREIMKKAYHEGLYYISSNKNIDDILKDNSKRTLYLFAGIPSFQDVCMNLFPREELYALKINIPYQAMVNLNYDDEEKVIKVAKVPELSSIDESVDKIYEKKIVPKVSNNASAYKSIAKTVISSKSYSTNIGITLIQPVSGTISSRFGYRSRDNHKGLDIAAPKGTAIKAAASGTVIFSGSGAPY